MTRIMVENEIKIKLNDSTSQDQVESALHAKFGDPSEQKDIIYASSKEDVSELANGNVIGRIRNSNSEFSVTMKRIISMSPLIRDEIEWGIDTKVQGESIFEFFGWKHIVTVVKTRRIFQSGTFTYCLDDILNLGRFLEIELITQEVTDVAHLKLEAERLVKLLKLPQESLQNRPYDQLMLTKKV